MSTRELFDANARSYDRVNTVIGLGLDRRWREWAAEQAVTRSGCRVLDAFAGTGLVGLRAAALGADVTLADLSSGMLAVARSRAIESGATVRIVEADLSRPLRLEGPPFSAVTVVFGARYMSDPRGVIRNLASLLERRGRLVVVDFVRPAPGRPVSNMAAWYFFNALPSIAGALAGRRELYDLLVDSTRKLGPREHLLRLISDAGLSIERTRMMGFGLVCGVVARRDQA